MSIEFIAPERVLGEQLTAPDPLPVAFPLARHPAGVPAVDIVLPVHNEEGGLAEAVRRLHAHLSNHLPYSFRITIADNASTDGTVEIADRLAQDLRAVCAVHLPEKGRGRALRAAWALSDAEVLAYMDVDLSTDLAAVLPLIAPLLTGHSDLAIGSRLARGSRVVRGSKREFISRSYNQTCGALCPSISPTPNAVSKPSAPTWRRSCCRWCGTTVGSSTPRCWCWQRESACESMRSPPIWIDDPNSSVDIVGTAVTDLKGVWRAGRALASGSLPLKQLRAQLGRGSIEPATPGVPTGMTKQLVRFTAVGMMSTLAYLLLFAASSTVMGAQVANLLALAVTAVVNTAANRRFTFGIRESAGAARSQLQGFGIFLLGLAITSGSLALLHAAAPAAGRMTELSVLILANLAATVMRFVLMRSWLFRRQELPRT